jgi:hypothetical protein
MGLIKSSKRDNSAALFGEHTPASAAQKRVFGLPAT